MQALKATTFIPVEKSRKRLRKKFSLRGEVKLIGKITNGNVRSLLIEMCRIWSLEANNLWFKIVGNGINGTEADSDSQNGDLDNNSEFVIYIWYMLVHLKKKIFVLSDKFDREDSEGSPLSECMSPSSQINFSPMTSPATSPQTYEYGELEEMFFRFPDDFVDTLIPNWMDRFIFIVSI
jgi:hypothetical protein